MGVKIEVFVSDGQSESRTTYKEKKVTRQITELVRTW